MSALLAETLLTIPEAARRLGKHRDTVRAWMRRGLLEWVELPDGQHTTAEAIERMTTRLAARRQDVWRRGDRLPSAPAQERKANKAHRAAVKVLKKLGLS